MSRCTDLFTDFRNFLQIKDNRYTLEEIKEKEKQWVIEIGELMRRLPCEKRRKRCLVSDDCMLSVNSGTGKTKVRL